MDRTVPAGAALLLDFIAQTEVGSTGLASYDVIYGHNQGKLPKPITTMNLGDLVDAQVSFTNRFKSSASGRYQFMRATLQDLARELGLRGTQIFDPDLQDRLGYHLLIRRGYNQYIAGKISRTEFGKRLAQEWASFPVLRAVQGAHRMLKRGETFYAGDKLNKALVTPAKIEAVLNDVKAAGSVQRPVDPSPVIETVPVVADPGELGTPPIKSKTVITNVLSGIGMIATAVGTFFGGLDWRVQLFICAMVGGFVVYAIKRRFDLYKAVKALHTELS